MIEYKQIAVEIKFHEKNKTNKNEKKLIIRMVKTMS